MRLNLAEIIVILITEEGTSKEERRWFAICVQVPSEQRKERRCEVTAGHMGIYLNPRNRGFWESVHSEIYVDKTELIACTNELSAVIPESCLRG